MIFLIIFILVFIVSLIFAVIRNIWVYNRRMELNRFEGGKHLIRQYVDYDTMLIMFWVWDIEQLKLPEKQNDSK